MPTYTYRCKKCSNTVDVFHSISAKPRVACPKCGGSCIRMIGTGAGIIFKGSGFYETDYKKSAAKTSSAASGAETKSETKSEPKKETKPAKKAAGGE